MESFKRARRPVRRQFDILHKDLEELMKKEALDEDVIAVKFTLFNETYDELLEHDKIVIEQLLKDDGTEADENKEYDDQREFKIRAETVRQLKEKLFPSHPTTFTESVVGSTETRIRNFKLPTVQIKKFTGELKDWLGFWAQFQKIDEDQCMHGSDKFWYLLQSLEPGTDAYEIATGYPQSNENYVKVITALKKQYGSEDIQLQVYIRELLSLVISNVNAKEKIPVKSLFLKLDSHLRALKTLNLAKADPETWLFPLVESSLPEDILYNWQRSTSSTYDGSHDDPPKTRLDQLMEFVEKEVAIKQRIEISRSFGNEQRMEAKGNKMMNKDRKSERRPGVPTLSSFHVGNVKHCVFCEKTNHNNADCFRAKKMDYDAKMQVLKTKGLCYRCCGKHLGRDCSTTNLECNYCKRKHLTILCREGKGQRDSAPPPPKRQRIENQLSIENNSANLECSRDVILQTLLVKVQNGNKSAVVRAFIDSGSQRSYILKSTAQKLNLEPTGIERVVHSLFGGRQTETVAHNKYEVKVRSLNSEFQMLMELRDQEILCGRLPKLDTSHQSLREELRQRNVDLSDRDVRKSEIELLIGADINAKILTGNVVNLKQGPVAIETKLGWTLMGDVQTRTAEGSIANLCLSMSVIDANVAQLWELEALGIKDPITKQSDEKRDFEAKLHFAKNISRLDDGRYSVKLPWRDNLALLPSNREVAFKRLQASTRKLIEVGLYNNYDFIITREWIREGFIEKVPEESIAQIVHYIPHRAVVKTTSLTTPVRPVFDGSCRVGKSPSLNDCLFKGDSYVQIIPELLLRFREKNVGFVADIRKAFQMIAVDHDERDTMRFLWWRDREMKEVDEYRHARVMFGATCSPFILGAVLEHHLKNLPDEDKETGAKLLSTFYVDNCVSSETDIAMYHTFKKKAIGLMSSAKMDLRMWLSNLEDLDDETTLEISVLGLLWNRKTDMLHVKTENIQLPTKISKRTILSVVQKVFDPVGFTAPALLPMKILLQRLWKKKVKWDDELPADDIRKFTIWTKELALLSEIYIPRLMTTGNVDRSTWSLHTFTDACQEAYSAVSFLRSGQQGEVIVQLVAAKSRVAPISVLTINKLELMGCLIGVRLAASVKKSLMLEGISEIYWSDSSTALAWIRRNDQWGTFVANRTSEINKATNASDWRHVSGNLNPADLPSRGCAPKELLGSRWWEGPSWLYEEENIWPRNTPKVNENEVCAELKKCAVQKVTSLSALDNVRKIYSFEALVRIVAYVRRFLKNYLMVDVTKRRGGPLRKNELIKAEIVLIREIQRDTFPPEERHKLKGLEIVEDDWGLLRVKTRLTYRNDPENFKYPMLLPSKRNEVRQLIVDTHKAYCHAGIGFLTTKLRNKYWILKARHTIRGVISKCYNCRRLIAKSIVPNPAPLPLDRVADVEVFEVVGLDLAGPLLLKNGQKVWLVIYTCAVFRAVHFELVKTISTKAFIKSLGTFIRRFRRPAIIYSDNGTNFRGADNLFRRLNWEEIYRDEGVGKIEWKFIPVAAPFWGGWWERLIRTAKDLLKRTIGKGSLTWKELEAVMITVAEVMNGRPLTYVSENSEDLDPLTPSLFLYPHGKPVFPEEELTEGQQLRFRYSYVQTIKKELRDRFLKEYLSMLVNRKPKRTTRCLCVGELVLVGSDNLKRTEWPLGRVMELIPGKDGVTRLARVKTVKGESVRVVQRLYPLEMDSQDQYEKLVQKRGLTTKSGRLVKVPERFQT